MTQDEIIEMYLQVSKELCNDTEWCWAGVGEPLQMFAKLVAAKEREAWATPVKIVQYNCTCGKTMKFESEHGVIAPQRTWVGLTDEDELDWDGGDLKSLVKAIEARLKELNT